MVMGALAEVVLECLRHSPIPRESVSERGKGLSDVSFGWFSWFFVLFLFLSDGVPPFVILPKRYKPYQGSPPRMV